MITVYEAHSSFDAKLIQGQLSFEEIDSHIIGDLLQGGMGELQAHGMVKVVVNEKDFEKAKEKVLLRQNNNIKDTKTKKPVKRPLFFWIVITLVILAMLLVVYYESTLQEFFYYLSSCLV